MASFSQEVSVSSCESLHCLADKRQTHHTEEKYGANRRLLFLLRTV